MDVSQLTKIDERILFRTEVGSHMWKMGTPESDRDIITVYAESILPILEGRRISTGKPQRSYTIHDFEGTREVDEQFIEINHLINLLCKGNVNAIWAVTSPLIISSSDTHQQLVAITNNTMAKSILPSIFGMATSQWNDTVKRAKVKDPVKSKCTAVRTLRFGYNLLCFKRFMYHWVPFMDYTEQEFCNLITETTVALLQSDLPDTIDELQYRLLLRDLRLRQVDRMRA
jgi:predicted nucleotidyltransferase